MSPAYYFENGNGIITVGRRVRGFPYMPKWGYLMRCERTGKRMYALHIWQTGSQYETISSKLTRIRNKTLGELTREDRKAYIARTQEAALAAA